MPLTYFPGCVVRDRGEEPVYDGRLWVVDPDDRTGPDGGPRDPEPVRLAAVEDEGEAATLARLLNDAEALKVQRDALLKELEETAAWLEERAEVLGAIVNDMGTHSGRRDAIRVEIARLSGRAALVRQTVAKAKGELS